MLNFTAGAAGMKSALKTAQIKRIVTAHKFVELGKLEELIAELSEVAEIVYLEDVRAESDAGRQGCGRGRPVRAVPRCRAADP